MNERGDTGMAAVTFIFALLADILTPAALRLASPLHCMASIAWLYITHKSKAHLCALTHRLSDSPHPLNPPRWAVSTRPPNAAARLPHSGPARGKQLRDSRRTVATKTLS
ncbi:hypothetical protein HC928_17655 [bacterium]|nr:hypothetical protein [bacterium]